MTFSVILSDFMIPPEEALGEASGNFQKAFP
jgi:hypothetical protein